MSIQSSIKELDAIKLEIKRNNESNRRLRERSKVLELQIKDYMEAKDHVGLKFKNQSIILENAVSRKRKVESKKNTELIDWLKSRGISEPEKACVEIRQLQKGEEVEIKKVKIKPLKIRETY